ncbi:MAG: hypothetical protein HQL41_02875 [Alphaproteobacteria bacterium]|nr:hypothetical protein [Alphaproteobacteria bacterium]
MPSNPVTETTDQSTSDKSTADQPTATDLSEADLKMISGGINTDPVLRPSGFKIPSSGIKVFDTNNT